MDVRFELFSSVTVHTLFDVYALVPDVHCHSQIHAIGSRCPCAKEFFSPQQIVRIAWMMVHAGEEPTLARVEMAWVFFSPFRILLVLLSAAEDFPSLLAFSRLSVHQHASLAPDDNHVACCQKGRFGCGRAACPPSVSHSSHTCFP